MNPRMYHLRIELLGANPSIFREFVVPGSISLDRLHDVIQIVVGWYDCHLYEFVIRKQAYTENPEEPHHGKEAGLYRLVDLIKQNKSTFDYLYDFGDNWKHRVTIINSRFVEKPSFLRQPFTCLEGQGMCPPEDVGGLDGFETFKAAIGNPDHNEHDSMKFWYASLPFSTQVFKIDHFSVENVNWALARYSRYSRKRYLDLGF